MGISIAKKQGLQVIREMQLSLVEGKAPEPKILEAVLLAVAAVLLLTPGLITDITGFSLLNSSIRKSLTRIILSRFSLRKSTTKSSGFSDSSENADYEILD